MERRSFFSVVAGLFAGAANVSSKPPPPPPVPEPQVPVDEEYTFSKAPDATHRDPALMFADIRRFVDAHPGAFVVPTDLPQFLRLGFSVCLDKPDGEDDVYSLFTIPIFALKGYAGPERDMLSTSAGRRELSADLMRGTV